MKSYFELLERFANDNKDSFEYATANTVLEALFGVYSECNCMDTDEIKTAFAVLYERMHGMPLAEMDRIIEKIKARETDPYTVVANIMQDMLKE